MDILSFVPAKAAWLVNLHMHRYPALKNYSKIPTIGHHVSFGIKRNDHKAL